MSGVEVGYVFSALLRFGGVDRMDLNSLLLLLRMKMRLLLLVDSSAVGQAVRVVVDSITVASVAPVAVVVLVAVVRIALSGVQEVLKDLQVERIDLMPLSEYD